MDNKTKNKKGQIKIQQTAFVLLAVTLFFVFVGLFVLMIQFSDIKESAEFLKQENALILVSKITNSPEFSCENSFDEISTNCVDSAKILALSENSEKYRDFWNVESIEVRKIYPEEDLNIVCTSSNYPDCGIINIIKGKSGTGVSNFVSLCRKDKQTINKIDQIYDKCEFARIIVTYKI